MLSQNDLVDARKAIEAMYHDTCDVVEHRKIRNTDNSTGFEDVVVISDIPCRLSFATSGTTNETESASNQMQEIKIFVAPEIEIKSGSKVVVTHLGKTTEFKNSGISKIYDTHQEILLSIFKGWS